MSHGRPQFHATWDRKRPKGPYVGKEGDCPLILLLMPKNCDTTSLFAQNPKKCINVPTYVFCPKFEKKVFFVVKTPISETTS